MNQREGEMLEYYKMILQKVSFNDMLFEKELKKSLNHILPDEAQELLDWVSMTFNHQYADIISQVQEMI